VKEKKHVNIHYRKIVTVPNVITFLRIGVIPFLVVAFFLSEPVGSIVSLSIFTIASVTDYVDGYVARKFQQVSKIGTVLDPIADKLLVAVTLLMLAGTGKIYGLTLIPAAIILCREIFISGLREFLSAYQKTLKISKLAKYKTVAQMLAVGGLLFNYLSPLIFMLGMTMMWISAVLTGITGVIYTVNGITLLNNGKTER
jgi:cardiolipin synthase